MVARNLERGSGLFHPQIDTAPYPNLFLVEPPIYAAVVVGVRRATGMALALEPAGRLVSALATTLAAWGLHGLVRRREGRAAALIATVAFATFPLTVRYGRAFQPDALMLGTLVAGLRFWDESQARGKIAWLIPAAVLVALGLALKIVSVYLLVPLVSLIPRSERRWKVMLALGLTLPALGWYLYAVLLLGVGRGSLAAADNAWLWLRALVPGALWRSATLGLTGRYLAIRAFTPLGAALAVWGLWRLRDRFWRVWGLAAAGALAVLAGKMHHEYYWLALTPVAAAGVGRALADVATRRPLRAVGLGCLLIGLSLFQCRSTWGTPLEWSMLPEAARAVRSVVPPGALLVAPEALLYSADRRGCRLEWTPSAARRAAGEWGADVALGDPLALVEFYRVRGARFVAVPKGTAREAPAASMALQEAIRRRYNVLVDQPGVLIAALSD
jgi:4-amino-4-deoxy-L-arabinose transferase-like glycosyltransferase